MTDFECSDRHEEYHEPVQSAGDTYFEDAPVNAVSCDTDLEGFDIDDNLPGDLPRDEHDPHQDIDFEAEGPAQIEELTSGHKVYALPSAQQVAEVLHERGTTMPEVTDRPIGGAQASDRQPPQREEQQDSQHTYLLDGVDVHGLTVDQIDTQYREGIQERRDSLSFDGERRLTPQEEDTLAAYNQHLISIGKEVGVDLRDRITDISHVHLFPRPDDYRAAVSTVAPESINSRGCTHPDIGVLAVARHDPLDNVYGIMHEEAHDVSHRWITPSIKLDAAGEPYVDAANSRVSVGYMPLGNARPHGANEAVTDMMTHRGMIGSGLPRIIPGYGVTSLLLSGIVQDTAANLGLRPQVVENEVTKGMLTPDRAGIQRIQQALGVRAVKIFMNTPGSIQTAPAALVASDMGSRTAERELWAREAGVPVGWFTWR